MKSQATALTILLALAAPALLFSQAPDTVWTRAYGGWHHETGVALLSTSDGNFVIAGSNRTVSYGSYDYCLWKIDPNGDLIWMHHYGTGDTEMASSIVGTPDGGFLMVGDFDVYGPDTPSDIYIVKIDSLGIQTGSRYYGGDINDCGRQIKQLPDGNYIVIGYTESFGAGDYDFWLLCLNADGDTLWTRTIGSANREWANAIDVTSDGGLIIGGIKEGGAPGHENIYLVKTDMEGNTLWTKTYGYEHNDRVYDIKQTPDGGYVAVGYITLETPYIMRDIYLLKTDADGDTLWTGTYGGPWDDWAYSLDVTESGIMS